MCIVLCSAATFFWLVGQFVADHMYSNKSQQHRSEWDKESQIFGHRLLNVSDAQEYYSGIQVDQPVKPKNDKIVDESDDPYTLW